MKTIINILVFTFLFSQVSTSQVRNFFGTTASENYGTSATGIGDFNADGFDDFIVGSPNGNGSGIGNAKIYFGRTSFPVGQPLPDVTINGSIAGENFGGFIAGNFDINDDGFKDVMISAKLNNSNKGRVYLFFGRCNSAPYTLNAVTNADIIFEGEATGNYFGWSVSKAGDYNGDCIDDIVLGAPYASSGLGRIYIIPGIKDYPSSNTAKLISTIPGVRTITGLFPSALLGFSVSYLGDMNNDNLGDLIIGAPGQGGTIRGHAYIFYGKCQSAPFGLPPVDFWGQSSSDDFGISVAGLGDINGNGTNDYVIGDWIFPDPSRGAAYVYDGSQSPASGVFTTPNLYSITGDPSANNAGRFGNSTAGIGDYTGDGLNDFLIGAYGYAASGTNGGREYRFNGFIGPLRTINPPAAANILMTGVPNNAFVGYSSSWAGDVNCDGRNDALWGGYGVINPNTSVNTGAAFLDLSTSPITPTRLYLRAFIQGAYNASSNLQRPTEVKVCLYNQSCELVDEKNVLLKDNGDAWDADGTIGIKFNNLPPNTSSYNTDNYYIVIKGICNSIIDTWSKIPINMRRGFTYGTAASPIDFTTSSTFAYGIGSQAFIDNSPLRYGIYSGDVNGDCVIDISDLSAVENDLDNFDGGCCFKTDISCDGWVDAMDLSILDYNAMNFIICQSPCQCPCP